jgi:hypothetical protein
MDSIGGEVQKWNWWSSAMEAQMVNNYQNRYHLAHSTKSK